MKDCQSIGPALSGYLDDELVQQERQKVELHLRHCKSCREMVSQMGELRQAVGKRDEKLSLDDALWQRIHQDAPSAVGQTLGWGLLATGYGVLVLVGLVGFFVFSDVPLGIRFLMALSLVGLGLLFGVALRQRLLIYKDDKYRKVKF